MRRAAAWSESVVDFRALERVREATGFSDVEARDRVQVAIGSWVGEQGGDILGGWRPGPEPPHQTTPLPPAPASARDNQPHSQPTPPPNTPIPIPLYKNGPSPSSTKPLGKL